MKTIVLVEDQEDARRMMQMLLESKGVDGRHRGERRWRAPS